MTGGLPDVRRLAAARSLSRPGALEAELAGLDLLSELRRAGIQQLWILVPLVVMSAVARPPTRAHSQN